MLQTPPQPSPSEGEGASALVIDRFSLIPNPWSSVVPMIGFPSPIEGEGLGVRSALLSKLTTIYLPLPIKILFATFREYYQQYILIHLMTEIFNKVEECEKRRSLREQMPKAEVLVWQRLRRRQVEGFKFRRQYSVDVYVTDFYCSELRLVIEIDGNSHLQGDAPAYDIARQELLEALGLVVLRFTNRQVYTELDAVIEAIVRKIREMK